MAYTQLAEWLKAAHVSDRILNATLAKLTEEEVFDVDDLRLLRRAGKVESTFQTVTALKITNALDAMPDGGRSAATHDPHAAAKAQSPAAGSDGEGHSNPSRGPFADWMCKRMPVSPGCGNSSTRAPTHTQHPDVGKHEMAATGGWSSTHEPRRSPSGPPHAFTCSEVRTKEDVERLLMAHCDENETSAEDALFRVEPLPNIWWLVTLAVRPKDGMLLTASSEFLCASSLLEHTRDQCIPP